MKHVLVIGGGVAGLEASIRLSELGFSVSVVEQSDKIGGKLNLWDRLFPNSFQAKELLNKIESRLGENIKIYLNTQISDIRKNNQLFDVSLNIGTEITADAILVSTGFDLFDANKKEEYGYGIYDNVITSAELELNFRNGGPLLTLAGKIPKRIGIIHCVGSRDEKAGHTYCSQVCCITAVKQAIEIREALPDTEVFCFYMDLRMFDRHFEKIYKDAQVIHEVQFIRGRLSEAFENSDGSLMLKVEDTLLGKPLRMNVDMVILMVGMKPAENDTKIKELLKLETGEDGFFTPENLPYESLKTVIQGVFMAGACGGPKTINNTINEARAVALEISEYLSGKNINSHNVKKAKKSLV
jgi:heterodisulfide reductase subunit A2